MLLGKLEFELDAVRGEFLCGIFTSKLNRDDLQKIAKRLPSIDQWGSFIFADVKRAVCDEFGLGSRDFQRACDVIKTSRPLSWMVGVVLPMNGISSDVFMGLRAAREATRPTKPALSLEERSSVLGLMRVGSLMYLPEEFDSFVTDPAG